MQGLRVVFLNSSLNPFILRLSGIASARVRKLGVDRVSITSLLYQSGRRKKLGITGPSRSSPRGVQRGKEIPETVETETTKNTTKTKKQKKRKIVNTRRNEGEKMTML